MRETNKDPYAGVFHEGFFMDAELRIKSNLQL